MLSLLGSLLRVGYYLGPGDDKSPWQIILVLVNLNLPIIGQPVAGVRDVLSCQDILHIQQIQQA